MKILMVSLESIGKDRYVESLRFYTNFFVTLVCVSDLGICVWLNEQQTHSSTTH